MPFTEYATTATLTSSVVTQAYDDLISNMSKSYVNMYMKPKEQDMCNSTKRWGVGIEPGNRNPDGTEGYYVRFTHKDKNTTDELTRTFETFEKALEFVNKTHKELK